jgi:sigma-B regulation protein RsbU (phosphoserine phosphatase)
LFRAKSDLEHSINQLVESINHDISKDNVNLMFITFFMGILNLKTGKMVYCNAGHNFPVILKKDGSQQFLSETHGIPLGINEQQMYKSAMMNIDKGDTLILYTDGITEALSIDGDFYGDERLEKVIGEKCPGLDTQKAARHIMEDVSSFTRNPEKSDDITLMVISYYPENKMESQDGKQ